MPAANNFVSPHDGSVFVTCLQKLIQLYTFNPVDGTQTAATGRNTCSCYRQPIYIPQTVTTMTKPSDKSYNDHNDGTA